MGIKKQELRLQDLDLDPQTLFDELIALSEYKGINNLRFGNDVRKRYCILTIMHENYPSLSLAELGWFFRKDHATVLHGFRIVYQEIETYKNGLYSQTYELLRNYVQRRINSAKEFNGLAEDDLLTLSTAQYE